MAVNVRIEGLEALVRGLDVDLRPVLRGVARAIAAEVQGKVAPYPPATAANSATQQRWYERGYGPRWRRRDGSIGGRRTSETLGRRWGIEAQGSGAVLGNIASYAAYVHSEEDQAEFHRRRGWVTDREAVDAVARSGVMEKMAVRAVEKALGW